MYTIEQIQKFLPQKYPFLFVDRVIDFKQNKYIKAQKYFTVNEQFFQGHFPTQPIVPGVILIEIMAQTSGLILSELEGSSFSLNKKGYLGNCNVKFLKTVEPGSVTCIEARTIILTDSLLSTECVIFNEKKQLVAQGKIAIILQN